MRKKRQILLPLDIHKRTDGWWIINIPGFSDCGPYKKIIEAEEDKQGIQRTLDNLDNHKFFTRETR